MISIEAKEQQSLSDLFETLVSVKYPSGPLSELALQNMCQQRGNYSAESYLRVFQNKEPNRPCKLHAALILNYYKVKQLPNILFLSKLGSISFFLDLNSHDLFLSFSIEMNQTLPGLVLNFLKSDITSIE